MKCLFYKLFIFGFIVYSNFIFADSYGVKPYYSPEGIVYLKIVSNINVQTVEYSNGVKPPDDTSVNVIDPKKYILVGADLRKDNILSFGHANEMFVIIDSHLYYYIQLPPSDLAFLVTSEIVGGLYGLLFQYSESGLSFVCPKYDEEWIRKICDDLSPKLISSGTNLKTPKHLLNLSDD